jgi:hypothetical protein
MLERKAATDGEEEIACGETQQAQLPKPLGQGQWCQIRTYTEAVTLESSTILLL